MKTLLLTLILLFTAVSCGKPKSSTGADGGYSLNYYYELKNNGHRYQLLISESTVLGQETVMNSFVFNQGMFCKVNYKLYKLAATNKYYLEVYGTNFYAENEAVCGEIEGNFDMELISNTDALFTKIKE